MPDRPRNNSPLNVFPSLRSRVWLLVLLVAGPLLVDSFVVYLKHRNDATARIEQDFQELVRSVHSEESRLVAYTKELLSVLADEAASSDAAKCSSLARRLMQTQRDYQNVGAVLPDGTLFCSAVPPGRSVNMGNRAWFREVVERKEMSRGYYDLGQVTGLHGIVFGLPVLDRQGGLRAVVYANTGLGWLERLTQASTLPSGWEALILSPDNKLVLRRPPPGEGRAKPFPYDALQSRSWDGLREFPEAGGETYLYGVAGLDSTGDDFRIVIGIPKAAVLAGADRDFVNHLQLLALAGIVSLIIGRLAIQRAFGSWAEGVYDSLRRFSAGERDLRVPEDNNIRELREIARALNTLFDDIRTTGTALKETRQDLGLALECANLATWDWCLPDGARSGDARLAEMLGYRPDELQCDAESWGQKTCPDDWPTIHSAMQSHFDGMAPLFECEYRMRHRDGNWVWVLARGKVVEWDGAGHPARMAGTAMDITGRKVIELELRRRTEELTALLDAIPAPVWIARDRECREILGNRAASGLYGMPKGTNLSLSDPSAREMLQTRHCRADGAEYAAEELPMQRATAEARSIENCEIKLCLPDGRNVWLFGNATPLFDEEGKVRGGVAAFADITQIRSMDEAVRRNEMVLAQAGKMAHLGAWSGEFAEADDWVIHSVYWSDETFLLYGYEPGEVVPSADLYSAHIHPDDRQRVWDTARQALAERRSFHCEYRIVRADGAERIVLDHGEFGFDPSGRPNHIIGACQDITDQKRAELELLRHRNQLESLVAERTYELAVAKEVAERASAAKSQFLANISHELRTPLNSLMLLAHVLSDNAWGNLTLQQIEYARMIELSGNDLVHLIDQLLDLSRIEAGRLDLDIKSVPFPDIMQNVHRIHRHVAQQKGLVFKMEISADVPAAIQTDPLRLQQLLRNLLSNAIKFTSDGSVTLRIRRAVSGWRYGNPALGNAETVIAFDVIDTGIGMESEQQRLILEAFEQFQNRPTGEYGGTGLGLTISSEIAALLGGELALTSTPRQGSTFTLFLPLAYMGPAKTQLLLGKEAKTAAHAAEMETSAEIDGMLAGKTVLVVDDDQRNRFALAAMLEKQRMRVLGASGGAEALDILGREAVDIVLMDIMMPVMDGFQATRAIRSDLGRSNLPVIALTADAMPATRDACLSAGCSDYLAKPVNNSDMLALLHEWMARSSAPVEDETQL